MSAEFRNPATPIQPIAVAPEAARQMLNCSMSGLYALLRASELQSFKIGRTRKILVSSIYAYLERRIAASRGGWQPRPSPASKAAARTGQSELSK
jgi:hypothetical protein